MLMLLISLDLIKTISTLCINLQKGKDWRTSKVLRSVNGFDNLCIFVKMDGRNQKYMVENPGIFRFC